MIQSKIEEYLQHCDPTIVNRGKHLLATGAVLQASYDVHQDMGGGYVKGTKKYTVAVNYVFDEDDTIETYCDCPYDWDAVCKHQVAVLLQLQAQFKRDFSEEPTQKTGDGELILSRKVFDNYQKSAEINGIEITPLSISETELNFSLNVKRNYWDQNLVPLKIVLKDREWRVDNCCKTSFNQICKHQSAIIYYISKHWHGFDLFQKLSNLTIEKDLANEKYKLPTKTTFDAFFALQFNPQDFEFTFIPRDKSFKSKDDIRALVDIFKTSKVKSQQIDLANYSNTLYGFAVGFVFNSRSRKSNDFAVQIITGKFNKDKTKLANSLEVYSGRSTVPEKLRLFCENLNYQIRQGNISEYPESAYNAVSEVLVQNIDYISSQICYQNPELYSASRSEIKQIYFQPNPVEISFELTKQKEFYHLVSSILFRGNPTPIDENMEIIHTHFLKIGEDFMVIPDYLTFSKLQAFLKAPNIIIHESEKSELFLVLDELANHHEIELNSIIKMEQLHLNKASFQIYLSEIHSFMIIKPEVMYENGNRFSLMSQEKTWEFDSESESGKNITRNLEAENNFRQLLFEFDSDFKPDKMLQYHWKDFGDIQGKWFFEFIHFCKENDIELLGAKNLKSLKYSPFVASVSLGISSNIDWFEAHLKVSFGDENVPLKKLYEALERREDFVKLSDGTLGMLPEIWLKKMATVLRSGEIKNDDILISKLKFNLIDSLFDGIDNYEVQQEIYAKKERLKNFSKIDVIQIPKTIKATLRDYQKEGFYWMNFLDEFNFGGCLADDMGLGKTIQLITFLAHQKKLKKGPSLVIVPKSLLYNWSAEIDKFCPSLKYLHHHGNVRKFDPKLFASYDVIITTYNTIINDIAKLKTFEFNYLILDESQAIKNPSSKRYKSVCLLKSRNRIVATGTPIENNTFDLFAQFNFLNPGLFGTQKDFKEQYSNEIDGKGDIQRADELKKIIHPFLLRRTKQQVAKDLPEKTEQILTVEMGEEQRKIYDYYLHQIRQKILTKIDQEGLNNSKMYVLDGLMKLRQICNSPALIKDSEFESKESAKIDLLMEQLIPLVKTNKVLVFSQFTSMLALIQERLEAENIQFNYLDGKTNQRQELVNEFNENESNRVFLISLKAGGTGLNLTSADYVFLVDPWWNPAAEMQAIDRTHRIGQKNHVFAYKMICENSIEEKILKLQEKKKMLSEDLIQAQENLVKGLKRDDIEILFG